MRCRVDCVDDIVFDILWLVGSQQVQRYGLSTVKNGGCQSSVGKTLLRHRRQENKLLRVPTPILRHSA